MSRKSRYTPDVPNIADMAKLYTNKTGIYARISHADGDNASESIANQLKICDSFIRRSDDLVRVRTYVDDGRSGYNINRPGFQKMLEDIHDGVLTEIVKRAIHYNTEHILTSSVCQKAVVDQEAKLEEMKCKITSLRHREKALNLQMGDLYDQYATHKILKNDFREHLSPISDELQLIEKWLEETVNERKSVEQECFSMKFCMQAFINYTQTHELTKDIADVMLDRIEVYANEDVIVYFKFPDLSFTDSAAK